MTKTAAPHSRDIAPLFTFLEDHIGLKFEGVRAQHVAETLRTLVERSEPADAGRYVAELRSNPVALDQLVEAVTVGETQFFRHPNQLVVLMQRVLPDLRTRRGDQLRVWSAGCATGEEAYTLAIMLEEAHLSEARVLGTDVSATALRVAQEATYRPWSVRSVEAKAQLEAEAGRYRVPARFRDRVQFSQLNLVNDEYPQGCDLIVCRNVLLYFTAEHVQTVGRRLAESLAEGGWIVTAATDPDLEPSDLLRRISTPAGLMYRKRGPDDAPDAGARATPVPVEPGERRHPAARRRDGGRHSTTVARREGDRRKPLAPRDPGPPHPPVGAEQTPQAELAVIRQLGNSGETERAERAAAAAIEQFALDPALRCVHAEILMALGRPETAATQASAAVYLDASSAFAHLTLGRAELARGRRRHAARALQLAVRLLDDLPPDGVVAFGDGATAAALGGYARTYLDLTAAPEHP